MNAWWLLLIVPASVVVGVFVGVVCLMLWIGSGMRR
ncbi:membrane protein [Microbacterium phage Jenos]|nr:membrane protein [Microbacterium phage Jenos]